MKIINLRHSEKELLARSLNGDQTAFSQIVDHYGTIVKTTVIGMLGDTVEADDVAQEVFIRFYNALNDFREEAQLGTYLTRIAINLSLNELKRRQRKNRWLTFYQKDDQVLQIEDKSVNAEQQDTKELVHKALQLLEPEFRSVVVLRMLDGYSVKETSEILKLPAGTIASRLSRGQKKLKMILSKYLLNE